MRRRSVETVDAVTAIGGGCTVVPFRLADVGVRVEAMRGRRDVSFDGSAG